MNKKTLFVGFGNTPQTWYRSVLPARALGHDWVGITEDFQIITGEVGPTRSPGVPDVREYDNVVIAQARGEEWLSRIKGLQSVGTRVLYETDDYLHGITKVPGHVGRNYFTPRYMKTFDMCMDACDGLIVSTPFLAERYKKKPVYICKNGIDPERFTYEPHLPRDYITVGWSGASGHEDAFRKWMTGGVADVIKKNGAKLAVIGAPECIAIAKEFVDGVIQIPWSAFETYPASMMTCDVLLAPAGNTAWDRGKSDLRWLEASALGIPIICDSRRYPDAALKVDSAQAAAALLNDLLQNPAELPVMGTAARQTVLASRSFPLAAEQWAAALS